MIGRTDEKTRSFLKESAVYKSENQSRFDEVGLESEGKSEWKLKSPPPLKYPAV